MKVSSSPRHIFKNYEGYLQADACSVYDALFEGGTIVEDGCWMHARRKFHEAKTSDPVRWHVMLAWSLASTRSKRKRNWPGRRTPSGTTWPGTRTGMSLRFQRSRPILDAIHAWLVAEQPKVLPKSPLGEAIGYSLNHWAALIRPLGGGLPQDRQRRISERAMKPVALGRKNWLFAGSDEGGQDRSGADESVHDLQGSQD